MEPLPLARLVTEADILIEFNYRTFLKSFDT